MRIAYLKKQKKENEGIEFHAFDKIIYNNFLYLPYTYSMAYLFYVSYPEFN